MKRVFFIFVILFAADITLAAAYYRTAVRYMTETEIPEQSDTAIVFFGSFGPHNGLSSESAARVAQAVSLYEAGKVRKIIAVGGVRQNREQSGAALLIRELQRLGVKEEDTLSGTGSFDSRTNWREAFQVMKENGWRRAVLVSSALHLLRLYNIAQDRDLELYYSAHRSDSPNLFTRLRKVHHEWIALVAAKILPEELYLQILDLLRRRFELI